MAYGPIERKLGRGGLSGRLGVLRGGLLGVATATAALGAELGIRAVKQAAEFDQQLRETNTLLNLTEQQFQGMRAAVLDVSSDLGVLRGDAADAFYNIVSAGIPAEQRVEALRQSATLARGGVADLSAATDLLTTSLNTFGKNGRTAQEISDAWFTTVRLGKTTIDELGRGIGNVANEAIVAGVSIEEVGAATATLTLSGLGTSVSMRRLARLLQELQRPGKRP